MGALREAAEAHVARGGTKCAVGVVRERLTADDSADLDYLLANPQISAANISARLHELCEVYLSDFSISRHRRGDCRCQR